MSFSMNDEVDPFRNSFSWDRHDDFMGGKLRIRCCLTPLSCRLEDQEVSLLLIPGGDD